jgi:putative DNA methylase
LADESHYYADAVTTYLGFAISKTVNRCNTIATWKLTVECPGDLFTKQSVQMTWDFAESNVVSGPSGSFASMLENTVLGLESSKTDSEVSGVVEQHDAASALKLTQLLISTDPPYYDNIGYADLSDVFYIWLRRSIGKVYPSLFGTVLVPKSQELIATPHRFGGSKEQADHFFEDGLGRTFQQMQKAQDTAYPLSVFYAFKQSESDGTSEEEDASISIASTGWETMLEGLIVAGFAVTGTWPMRTERGNRTVAMDTNALASSIVLVCRPRPSDAPIATRREFIAALKRELPPALKKLQQGAIAPVDLAQATIGPGMAVYSRFAQVLEADGSPMRVRAALALINQSLDEFFAEQEGEFDSDTRWALAWFEQFGHDEGPYGDAETLSKAKNTSTDGLVRAGILQARAGKVRLLRREELDPNWSPETDERQAIWEATQYLIRALDTGGESVAAGLLKRLGSTGEIARDLAYRLYAICERKGWANEALAYNMLAAAWPRLVELAGRGEQVQEGLL